MVAQKESRAIKIQTLRIYAHHGISRLHFFSLAAASLFSARHGHDQKLKSLSLCRHVVPFFQL